MTTFKVSKTKLLVKYQINRNSQTFIKLDISKSQITIIANFYQKNN